MSKPLRNAAGRVDFIGSFPSGWPELGLPEVAFAGRSNVGKSSALNTLLGGRKAARVSGRPGRTQAINLFRLGQGCVFADLPGYGFARVPESVQEAWKGMVEGYLSERTELRGVVVLVDSRRDPLALDLALIAGLREFGMPMVVVATKIDKLKRSQRDRQLAKIRRGFGLGAKDPVPFSSVTREGKDAVWDRIEALCAAPPLERIPVDERAD